MSEHAYGDATFVDMVRAAYLQELPNQFEALLDEKFEPISMMPRGMSVCRGSVVAELLLVLDGLHHTDRLLKLDNATFSIKTGPRGHDFLVHSSGTTHESGIAAAVLRRSTTDCGPILRPGAGCERYAGLRGDEHQLAVRQEPVRLVQRALTRMGRQIRRSAKPLPFASLWRRLLRAAMAILRQLLGLQRQRYPDTPEAVTHSHTVDQYRTRGPNPARKTSSPMVLREFAPI